MTTRMDFSVVIPTCNRLGSLRQTLAAVAGQTHAAAEMIVVDDGSTDGTGAAIEREFSRVRVLRQANRGPAAARNAGIRAASSAFVAFTDDDCQPPPEWLARLADGFARHPEVAGVGGALLAPESVRRVNLLAEYEAYVVRVRHGAGEKEVLGGLECPAGGTNNIAYQRQALEDVAGFDESFPYAAGEDADLQKRLAMRGARFLYIPLVVTHLQDYTWPAFRRQQYVRGKGRIYYDRKWGPRPSRAVVALRFFSGALHLLRRLPQMPRLALAWPAINEMVYGLLGQWAAVGELRQQRSG